MIRTTFILLFTLLFSFSSANAGDCYSHCKKCCKAERKMNKCHHRDHHRGQGIDGADCYDHWEMDKDHSKCCATWYDNCSHHCEYCPPSCGSKKASCGDKSSCSDKSSCCEKAPRKKCCGSSKC